MTEPLAPALVASRLEEKLPGAVRDVRGNALFINKDSLRDVAHFLKTDPKLRFEMLVSVTGVDYLDYFEVVYHLTSITHNHSLVLKTRCPGRDNPEVPSLTPVWRGAELQEREVYDLLGISFAGHPRLKRIFLWEGFPGYPLRRDYP